MPVDKDMCKTVTIRFSLLNENHVRLLEQMEQECMADSRTLSKNKLIIRCIEEHYTMLANRPRDERLEEKMKSYVEEKLQSMRREIGTEIYKDLLQMFAGGLVTGNRLITVPEENVSAILGKKPEQTGQIDVAEIDLSGNADIMEDIMKWS